MENLCNTRINQVKSEQRCLCCCRSHKPGCSFAFLLSSSANRPTVSVVGVFCLSFKSRSLAINHGQRLLTLLLLWPKVLLVVVIVSISISRRQRTSGHSSLCVCVFANGMRERLMLRVLANSVTDHRASRALACFLLSAVFISLSHTQSQLANCLCRAQS